MDKAGSSGIRLELMTDEMYHRFFRDYQNDPDLLREGQEYLSYSYDRQKVEEYIRHQRNLGRIPIAIICNTEIVGEILIKDIKTKKSATFSIVLKNAGYKDKGIGTAAERLAVQYAFEELDLSVLFAEALRSNGRSRHVLEKVGFVPFGEDGDLIRYRIDRAVWDSSKASMNCT